MKKQVLSTFLNRTFTEITIDSNQALKAKQAETINARNQREQLQYYLMLLK